jgi:hypothetical protein
MCDCDGDCVPREEFEELQDTVEFLKNELLEQDSIVFGYDGQAGARQYLNTNEYDSLVDAMINHEDSIAESTDDGSYNPEVYNSLLEVHQDYLDLREGHTEKFNRNGASARRAAVLFGCFIRQETQDRPGFTGISRERKQNTIKINTENAKRALEDAEGRHDMDFLASSGNSTVVKRAFKQAVRATHDGPCPDSDRDDGRCQDPMTCRHGLLSIRTTKQHQLRAELDEFLEYLRDFEATILGSVEAAQANSVVSREEGGALPPARADGGDTYSG